MRVARKRIRSIERYLSFVEEGTPIIVGLNNPEEYPDTLRKIGFDEFEAGNTVLPSAVFGNISKFNAEGGEIVHKDRPKETVWHMVEWEREEWRGRYDTESVTDVISRRYKRYPRTPILPPSVELSLQYKTSGELVLTSPSNNYTETQKEMIKHKINLFLEIFGECYVFSENLNEIIDAQVKRLNWNLLPKGPMPWDTLNSHIQRELQKLPDEKRSVAEYRLKTINEYGPQLVAVGKAGFYGYIILGFDKKNIHLCESLWYGNATYVFGEDYEELSKLPKAEILREGRHIERIIHSIYHWKRRLRQLLS